MVGFKQGIEALKSAGGYGRMVSFDVDVERLLREHYGITNIRRSGEELTMKCPLPFGLHKHGDRTGKFAVNITNNLCNCWVCGGGDLVWFVKNMDDISYEEAIDVLRRYRRADETPEQFIQRVNQLLEEDKFDPDKPITSMHEDAERYIDTWAQNQHPYWSDRGFKAGTIAMWKLGYDPVENRVVMPHYVDGKLVGWQKRILPPDVVTKFNPKWRSSDDFPANDSLFNWDIAKMYPSVIVVEAGASVIWLHQLGIPNVVATFGSGFGQKQAQLLRQFDDVVIWYDADTAGWKGALNLNDSLSGHTNVWMVDSWQGDPNETSPQDCWDVLYGRGLIPGYLYDEALRQNLDKVTYHELHKVRQSRKG